MKKIFLILSILFCKTISAQVNLDSSLVACYALNGHAAEPINGLNGILHNVNTVSDRFSIANSAMNFNCNVNSFVELPNDTMLKSQVLSFSAWIKLGPSFFSKGFILFTKNGNINAFEAYSLSINDSPNGKRLRVTQASATNSVNVEAGMSVIQNTWYHIAFTMDANVLALYLNGVFQNTATISGQTNFSNNKNVYLGGTNETGNNQPFCGVIDNVRFYSRVLNAMEVNVLYANDPACMSASAAPVAAVLPGTVQCVGQPVTMTNLSSNNPTHYYWEAPSAIVSNSFASNPTFIYNTVGTHNFKMIATNALGSDTIIDSLKIKALPTILSLGKQSIDGTYYMCRNAGVVISVEGASTYTWETSEQGSSIFVSPFVSKHYVVSGTDTNGCIGTATVFVLVFIHCTNIFEKDINSKLSISPNPSHGKFKIESLNESITEYFLLDVAGELVKKEFISHSFNFELDLSAYPKGIYILNLSAGDKIKRFKLINY